MMNRTYIARPVIDGDVNTAAKRLGLRALDAIANKIADLDHVIRVSSLQDIINDLKSGPTPETIQIIGHGSPGRISLGHYWNDSRYNLVSATTLLDGNPYAYSLLTPIIRGKIQKVHLWGCYAGSNRADAQTTGSSLLFDLRSTWECDVLAARSYVSHALFHPSGRHTGAQGGYVGKRWRLYAGESDPPAPLHVSSGNKLEIRQIVGVPELAPLMSASLQRTPIKLSPNEVREASTYTREVKFDDLDHPLALDEVLFEIMLNEEPYLAESIAGGEFLRVHDSNGVRYLANESEAGAPYKLQFGLTAANLSAHNVIQGAIQRRILEIGSGLRRS